MMIPKKTHILVIRLSAMGDVAMTVPVLRALVTQYPTVKITIVSRPFFKSFFEDIPNLDFFSVDLQKRHKGLIGLLRLYFDLKKRKIDCVADLHNVLRSKVIRFLFFITAKKVAATDKGRKEKKELTRFDNKIFKQLPTMFENHLKTFNRLGYFIDFKKDIPPKKRVLSSDLKEKFFYKENNKLIGIAPFAQYDSKIYPLDLMKEVINELVKNKNICIYLFGGKSEETSLLDLKQGYENVEVLAGKLTLKEEMDVISNLNVMISMDSGNAHIAAMLGIKVITLWGATHPFAGFKPFNQPDENCLVPDRNKYPLLPTSVYGNKIVIGYEEVMRTISPETICSLVLKYLKD